jgi:hypothetical protein
MFIILSVISACKNSTGITIADSWKFPNTVESRYIKIGLLQISVKSKFSVNFEITIFNCNEILNRVFLLLIGIIRIKSYNIILTFCHHSLKKIKIATKKTTYSEGINITMDGNSLNSKSLTCFNNTTCYFSTVGYQYLVKCLKKRKKILSCVKILHSFLKNHKNWKIFLLSIKARYKLVIIINFHILGMGIFSRLYHSSDYELCVYYPLIMYMLQ